MAKFALADPVFAKAVKALSEEAQRNLVENGLSDPGVLDAYLRDPGTELDELAREPGDVVKLVEVWAQAKRAARGQRAEFARRGLDQFARWDKARKAEARAHEEQGPNELQRAAEAPPPWHCRLPSRLARSTRLEGDSRAREKAEEEERQRWVAEVTELLLTLSGTPTADKAARTADPRLSPKLGKKLLKSGTSGTRSLKSGKETPRPFLEDRGFFFFRSHSFSTRA